MRDNGKIEKGNDWNEMVKGLISFLTNLDSEISYEDGMMAMQMSRAISQQMRTWDTIPEDADLTLIPPLKAAMERHAV